MAGFGKPLSFETLNIKFRLMGSYFQLEALSYFTLPFLDFHVREYLSKVYFYSFSCEMNKLNQGEPKWQSHLNFLLIKVEKEDLLMQFKQEVVEFAPEQSNRSAAQRFLKCGTKACTGVERQLWEKQKKNSKA